MTQQNENTDSAYMKMLSEWREAEQNLAYYKDLENETPEIFVCQHVP
jgi:hypothetical protein